VNSRRLTRFLIAAILCGSSAHNAARTSAADAGLAVAATAQELQRRLAEPVDVAWSGAALREALVTRGRLSGVAVMIDRRVDPSIALELTAARQPLSFVLERVAAANDLGVSYFGPLVYLGPPAATRDLRTVAELRRLEAQSLPLDLRTALARKAPWSWSDLAESRALFAQLTGEGKLNIADTTKLPHDLWPAATLPPLSLGERLTLLTASFGLTYRIDGATRTLTVVPIEESPRIARSYTPGGDVAALAKQWKKIAPEADIRRNGAALQVTARLEDHERFRGGGGAPVGNSPTPNTAAAAEQRYTLRIKNRPFSTLVNLLRDTHKLPIDVDDAAIAAAGISLETFTSVEVKDATLEELLRQAGAPLGLDVQKAGSRLQIVPLKK